MIACPKCGTKLDDDVEFCPKDGATVRRPRRKSMPVTIDSPEAAGDPLIGRLLDGRYKIRARLGSGGVGAVYEADHVGTKRTVAIKVLHQMFADSAEFRKRFEREAQGASKLDHPGCVAVLDFGRVERVEPAKDAAKLHGTLYLVMEFVRGELLLDRMDRGRVPPAEAIEIGCGLLGALAHAHSLGMIHRDVKPANIILTPSGQVKLLDFGLAKDTDSAVEPLTQAGLVFGTPGYLSPEQAGGKPIDFRSDLYALGVVLFEMVCGRRLFPRKDPIDQVRDHLMREPDRPRTLVPQLSPELEAVILRALAKSPDARFASAKEFADALTSCRDAKKKGKSKNTATGAQAAASPRAGSRSGSGRGLALVGGGIVALAGAVLALLYLRHPTHAVAPAPTAPALPLADASRRRLATATAYQRKLWCSDALEELERAVREDPRALRERETVRVAIACLTPKTQAKAIRFLVERVGASATPALKSAAASDPNTDVRHGAARALERMP